MTKYLLSLLLLTIYIQADCKDYKLLGAKNENQKNISTQDTIKWDISAGEWSVSQPFKSLTLNQDACKDRGYILINDNSVKYKTLLHHKNYYDLKKGWNYFSTPKEGVDVARTFSDAEFVYVYDARSKAWAGYSPKKELMDKIKSTRILELKYIEPKRGFYVLSNKAVRTEISSKLANEQCQKIMNDKNFDVIYDSGIDADFSYNGIKSIALKSRNHSHMRKGVYNDSRVAIMTPKIKKLSKNKKAKKYAPAIPKMMIHFNEAYADHEFYAYDFLNETCHKGFFPSKKRPPAPMMKKIK
jgi:hypothetical protein